MLRKKATSSFFAFGAVAGDMLSRFLTSGQIYIEKLGCGEGLNIRFKRVGAVLCPGEIAVVHH